MEVKKVGQVVEELVKKMRTQEGYETAIRRFLELEKRNPDDVTIEKQGKNIIVRTRDPQMIYFMQVRKNKAMDYLKKQVPQDETEDIIIRLGNNGR